MLGADHHGYVGRLMAMCAAFGDTPHENLEILIGQMVNLVRDGEPVRMSKRAGTVVTHRRPGRGDRRRRRPLRAGPLLQPTPRSTSTSTCGRRQSSDNPVYYVQYAHARLCLDPAQRRRARASTDAGRLRPGAARRTSGGRPARARWPSSRGWSRRRPSCASRTGWRATSRTTAATFHRFYDDCRVLPQGDEEPTDLHRARLLLVDATRIVFANGLDLLGVSAPERM